jgi:glycosyltransferase involved in cell wall biosynthesis
VPHPSRPDDEVEGGVTYHRIRMGRVYKRLFRKLTRLDPFSFTDRILRYTEIIRPAVIHVHNAPQLVDKLFGRVGDARMLLHMHNEKQDPVNHRVDALVGCSRYVSNWFEKRGLAADRFATLPNGVDENLFAPASTPDAARNARERLGIPAGRFVVMFVGRISPEKGPDLLARAARHLDPSRFHCVFVGEWPAGDPDRSERVRFSNQLRLELEGVPCTLIDTVAPAEMHRIYALGDLVVIPSRFEEPFSMVAIEAMASGVAVLALRKGGMAEYMVDGHNAIVIEPNATDLELAVAIRAAAANPETLRAIVAEARDMVVRRFTWQSVVGATEALYDQILGGTSGA